MQRLLIVSDPPAKPGYLPRLRYLCDYLVRKGYDVTLLTEVYQELPFAHTYPIEQIKMYNGSAFDWFIKTVWTLITDWHNRVFAQRALAKMEGRYDVVVCTAFSDFPLGAAQRIAKAWRVPLVCDIRDLDEQVDDSTYQYKHQNRWLMPFRRLYRAVHIRRRNRVLRSAYAVTTVSKWHANFIKSLNSNVHVVYNGYDPTVFYPEDTPTDTFRVSYIGSLSAWQRPALEQIQAVTEVDLHTPTQSPVSFDKMGEVIRQSSVMIVLTDTHTHGMLTTKFYEALGCEKPILCVPSDEGELAQMIAYTQAGIATNDTKKIQAFIDEQYKEWKAKGYTRQQTMHREQFSRETQCELFERILKTVIP